MKKHPSALAAAVVLLLWLSLALTGCASKKFVQQGLTEQDQKISGLKTELKADIEKNREEQNQKIQSVVSTLSADTQKAFKAAQDAMTKAEQAEVLARGKLLYGLALNNDNVKFDFGSIKISDSAKAILDDFIAVMRKENRNVFIEIHGHTDSTGDADYNEKLGLERAEAVERYLFEKGMPLHRLAAVSYGESQPVGDNKTAAGRAKNRRVVILVLE